MLDAKTPNTGSDETVNVRPSLSSEAQKDLETTLNETASAKDTWVNENRRDLYRSFAKGKKYDPMLQKDIDVVTAEEGTNEDLRYALVSIPALLHCNILRRRKLTIDVCRIEYTTHTAL